MKIKIVSTKNKKTAIQEASSGFSKQIKAYDDVVKELSFQIATMLVKAQDNPKMSKRAGQAILRLLKQGMATAQAMSVEEDKIINPNKQSAYDLQLFDDGAKELTREVDNDETDRERKDRLFKGHSSMTRLAHGIVEEILEDEDEELHDDDDEIEEAKKKKTPCDKVAGNPYHDAETGRWSKTDKEGKPTKDFVYSKFFNPKCRSRAKGGAGTRQRKAIPNVKLCGRGKDKEGHGQYRCRDNYRIWEESEMEELREHFQKYL